MLAEVVVDVSNTLSVLNLLLENSLCIVDRALLHRLVEARRTGQEIGVPRNQGGVELHFVLVEHRFDGGVGRLGEADIIEHRKQVHFLTGEPAAGKGLLSN